MAARRGPRRRPTAPAADPSPGLGHGEYVVYPGTRAELYDVLERLSAAAGDSPDFGTPGVSLDRTRLTVRWFGEPPAAVARVLDSAEGVTVALQHTPFRPGDLRAEADRLAGGRGPVVQSARARPEGDGIDVLVAPSAVMAAGTPAGALTVAGVTSSFPLFPEEGTEPPG